MMRAPIGEAAVGPLPLSTNTVTLISGVSAGAKPVNQPCVGRLPLVSGGPWYSAVPVLPATRRPGILNHFSHGPSKAHSIAWRMIARLLGSTGTTRPLGFAEKSLTVLPSGLSSARARCGWYRVPPFAITLVVLATCSGVARTAPLPMAMLYVSPFTHPWFL